MPCFCHESIVAKNDGGRASEGTVGQHHLDGPEESDKGGGLPCNLSATQ